ncbi:LADA_0B01354g1_1 [Lachancea dasiensis]|uniref:LADA_0B01354g1_1 n=1 Tax=Lachancea dasiensis TaxID=1072105 RepID=A0A1G4IRQ7_9SACH|nr:LADA_0B01354g1_1 [Lachancea dasiensis]
MGLQMSKSVDPRTESVSDSVLAEKANTIASPMAREGQAKSQDESSFQSRVARLSICEDEKSREMIMKSVRQQKSSGSLSEDISDGSSPSASAMQQQRAGSKRRRRRSSGVAGPTLGNLRKKAEELHSTTSTSNIKKKKRTSKPASIVVSRNEQKKVSIKDLRDLVLYIFQDTNNSTRWVQVENRSAITKMIVLFVPGLLPEDFKSGPIDENGNSDAEADSKSLASVQDSELIDSLQRFPVSSPGSKNTLYSAYNSFVNVGLSKKEKEERRLQLSKRKVTLNDLIMTTSQLLENEYPIHEGTIGLSAEEIERLSNKHAEQPLWKNTQAFDHDGSHTFAMDCEMCMSAEGLVLTRVSLVDFDCNLIYDTLVKPDVPITDYLTKYSGITEEKLQDVTTTLEDAQNAIIRLVSSGDVLIGHSLQSDLNVLKLRHPRIIDTAVIYEHKAGPPFRPALRYLASEYLSQDIQNSEGLGHDSFEDARACMELAKLKVLNGLAFGVGINTENLFERLSKTGVKSMCLNDYAPKLTELCSIEDAPQVNMRCQDDEEVFDNINKYMNNFNLFVGRLRELEFARNFSVPSPGVVKKDVQVAKDDFGQRLETLYRECPPSTVFLICSGSGDTRQWTKIMGEINDLDRDDRNDERKKRETEIHAAVSQARDAIALLAVKKEIH